MILVMNDVYVLVINEFFFRRISFTFMVCCYTRPQEGSSRSRPVKPPSWYAEYEMGQGEDEEAE